MEKFNDLIQQAIRAIEPRETIAAFEAALVLPGEEPPKN